MKLKKLSVDFRQVQNLEEMHNALAKIFDFPDFYGKNVNALIDCWSSLRYPENGMVGVSIDKDESLLLEVKAMSRLDPIMMNHFVNAVEGVNERSMEEWGQQPLILLLPA